MLHIVTNNQARDLLYWWELALQEQAEFDYLDDPEEYGNMFFRYKGECYDLGEFSRVDKTSNLQGWQYCHNDSFFSGILVKFPEDGDRAIVGWFYS